MGRPHVDVDRITAPAFALADELDPGAGPPHAHARHQLLYAASGSMRLELEEGSWLLPAHRAALVTAKVEHRVVLDAPAGLRTIYWSSRVAPAPAARCQVFTVSPLAREMLLHAMRFDPTHASDRTARTFLRALIDVASELAARPIPCHLPVARTVELRRALEIVHAHLAEPSMDATARRAGMSSRTLARRMDAELGMGFREYVHLARMRRAMERLGEPGVRVGEVAAELGFATPSAFTHAFARHSGETPRAWAARAATSSVATAATTAGRPTRRK